MKHSDGKEFVDITNHHHHQSQLEMSLYITEEAAIVMMLMLLLLLEVDQTLLVTVPTNGIFIIPISEMLTLNGFTILIK